MCLREAIFGVLGCSLDMSEAHEMDLLSIEELSDSGLEDTLCRFVTSIYSIQKP